jgi:hypothetical protein
LTAKSVYAAVKDNKPCVFLDVLIIFWKYKIVFITIWHINVI